jgi:hypothetical protein
LGKGVSQTASDRRWGLSRTDIHSCMTGLLRSSGYGGSA